MLFLLKSPAETARELAERARQVRLARGWRQVELSSRSGVALSTLRLFERTGQISLERLLMIASTLNALEPFEQLFQLPPVTSLAEVEARQIKRKRARRVAR